MTSKTPTRETSETMQGVDADKIQADFRDGVLEVTMPAPPRQERHRRIEVRGGHA